MKITAHFSLAEFACRDGTPYPVEWIEFRLRWLCLVLEAIRSRLGDRPVTIVSGYRTPAYNRRIGSARRSQHIEGRAADITVKGVPPARVRAAARAMHRDWIARLTRRVEGRAAAIAVTGQQEWRLGGLGAYPGFTHIDVRPGASLVTWRGSRRVS